ncbi:MAG: metallophosphoesterase [Myxococcales bacterium]|nr:metallophosphoesterase [Myxococcales bacterium]
MRVLLFLLIGLFGAANVAAAEPDEPAAEPTTPRGAVLVATGAPWRWQVITAPSLAPQLGALAVSGLDVVAGRSTAPASVLGHGAVPGRWPYDIDGDPLRVIPAPAPDQRIAAAFGVTTFSLTAADQGLAMLELRLRYEDGVAAWLNGVEVVREALRSRAPTALADRPHGPEWETFYLPVAPGLLRLGRNVLAIEIHPSARHTGPSLELELRGRRDRGIVRGPVLADVAATSARIVVDTDPDLEAVLEWGTGAVLDRKERSPAGSHHTFSLTGLPERAQIRYRVHAGVTPPQTYAFHTMPGAGDVIRIGIYGDVRGGHATHRALVEQMLAEPLDLVGVTGDMVLRGADQADWQRFFAITQPLLAQVRYLPAIGNHDLGARNLRDVLVLPPGPPGRPDGTYWYSYDLADVHIVALDSNAYELVDQATWLEADLAAARARKVRSIIVLTHDGPYSRGYHRGNVDARARYVPILAKHHVDLVLSGHDHLYQRGEADGIRYVVSGGGGASLYAITCGVRGKPSCAVDDGMQASAREHHFLVLTIGASAIELCARRPDGRLLEACTRLPLWRG